MDKNKILKDVNAIDILGQMPKAFIEQFVKISCYYLAYMAIDEYTTKDRTDYINESFNAINLLNKLIATASNGQKIESQVKIPNQNKDFNSNIDNTKSTEDITSDDNRVSSSNNLSVSKNSTEFPLNQIKKTNDIPMDNMLSTKMETEIINKDGEYIMATNKSTSKPNKKTPTTVRQIFIAEMNNWGISSDSFAYQCMLTLAKVGSKNDTPLDAIHKIAEALDSRIPTVASAFANMVKKADFKKTEFVPKLKRMKSEDITKEIILKEYISFCK